MLKGISFVSEIGAGTEAIADLYKDRQGNKFILRTTILPPNHVFINESGNYQFIYQFSTSDRPTMFTQEMHFYNLVGKMPDNESKHFVKLIRYDITKNAKFDASRLKGELTSNDITDDRIYMRQLIEYAGEPFSFKGFPAANLLDQLLTINRITRKYKWHLLDFHTGNFCILNGIVKAIDYTLMTDMNIPYNATSLTSALIDYQANFNLIIILGLATNVLDFYYGVISKNLVQELLTDMFIDFKKYKKYRQIKAIIIHMYNGTQYRNYIEFLFKDIEKGNYLYEYRSVIQLIVVLQSAIELKSFVKYWGPKNKYATDVKHIVNQSYINKLLNLITAK